MIPVKLRRQSVAAATLSIALSILFLCACRSKSPSAEAPPPKAGVESTRKGELAKEGGNVRRDGRDALGESTRPHSKNQGDDRAVKTPSSSRKQTAGDSKRNGLSSLRLTIFNALNFGSKKTSASVNRQREIRLRDYLQKNYGDTDVFILQEVVDKQRFEERVLPDWSCVSYDSWEGHQYVMICVAPGLSLERHPSDDDFAIEEISYDGRYRPAVHALVQGRGGGDPLLYVLGVHLKANPSKADIRARQMRLLAGELQLDGSVPVVIAGDFNTTAQEIAAISRIFNDASLGLRHLHHGKFTYNDGGSYQRSFDHFWVSESLAVEGAPQVFPICDDPEAGPMSIQEYNSMISDHCPVSITVHNSP